ncbi:DNA gyrase inhibitor YacG [Paraburkholderia bryophila]|uniref:DNA gyrase inhibitor YacG n=1 Tax=Burkholderiaceae TaxID=119060 RepID=UPI0009DE1675|nr:MULTISPECIES: DNA gyrase inhibitor YacG [Burkholderiaceae]
MPTFVKCPTCGKDVLWTSENRFRPFCSDRCKQVDLGAWAAEKYKIGGTDQDAVSDESPGGDASSH